MLYAQAGLIVVGILWMLGFGFLYLRSRRRASEAENWPAVQGKILWSHVKVEEVLYDNGGRSKTFLPQVSYSYSVGGRELLGERIGFGTTGHLSYQKAEADIAAYAEGATPMVRYNPDKPMDCVLETSQPGRGVLGVAAAGLLLIPFAIFLPRMLQ